MDAPSPLNLRHSNPKTLNMVLAKQNILAPQFPTPALKSKASDKAGHLEVAARGGYQKKMGDFLAHASRGGLFLEVLSEKFLSDLSVRNSFLFLPHSRIL